jgi:hypothetical protein
MESLGRTVGPVWGAAALQHLGESLPYVSAAGMLVAVLALSMSYHTGNPDRDPAGLSA